MKFCHGELRNSLGFLVLKQHITAQCFFLSNTKSELIFVVCSLVDQIINEGFVLDGFMREY